MRLLIATRSTGKQAEFRRMLERTGHEVVFPDDVAIGELPEEGTLESADSFEGNARRKAEYFQRRSGLPTVADDSGLEVLSLGGAPGVRSKRWAGATGTAAEIDAANNAELLHRLRGAPEIRRSARYRCVLVFISTLNAVPGAFEGSVAGRILEEPRGINGFGYDPFFWSVELQKTFGEATAEEKDDVSHRGRALVELIGTLR